MKTTKQWGSAVLLGLATACAPVAPPVAPAPAVAAALAAGEQAITARAVYDRIAFLASNEMRGRNTPSPGLEAAAEYMVSEFRGMGLQPAGDDGSFIQRWPFRQVTMNPATVRLVAETRRGTPPAMVFAQDFFAVPAARDSVVGTPVFLGPMGRVMAGFTADVADRIAVVAIGTQLSDEIVTAARHAEMAGARGLVLVLHPTHSAAMIGEVARELRDIRMEFPLPTFAVRFDHAQAIFRAVGLDPAMLTDATHARAVVLNEATLRMHAPLTRAEHRVPNVVAVLPGRDVALRDEYIVLSAHFDHVGVGEPDARGDSIYNGADDNASGTAVMMEVAKAMAALPEEHRPRRSVMFLGVSGEEKGLLGSRYFVDNPTVPIEQIVGNINLDMVGRNDPSEVIAIGPEYTDIGETADRIARKNPGLRLRIVPDAMPQEMLFFRSDHFSFVRRDIPAIFFFTGLHEDYHRPSDTVEKIDTDKAARIARLVFQLTHELGTVDQRPQWLPGQLDAVRRILRGSQF